MSTPKLQQTEHFFQELRILISCSSPFICKVHGWCHVSDCEYWLVLEYANGGNLRDYLSSHKNLPYAARINLARQATNALHFLHTSKMLHRDIKSFNFLVHIVEGQPPKLVLSDFGLSKSTALIVSKTNAAGTLRWASPEVLCVSKQWSEKSDVYSLGMVIFEIFSSDLPFQYVSDVEAILGRILAGKHPCIDFWPEDLVRILVACWDTKPANRPTALQLQTYFSTNISEELRMISSDYETFITLLGLGANVEETNEDGQTALHLAALNGDSASVETLFRYGANAEATDTCGRTPLHLAALNGAAEAVETLLRHGANMEATDYSGRTALSIARVHTVGLSLRSAGQVLIRAGANLEVQDGDGCTALHTAASKGDTEGIQFLAHHGAKIAATCHHGTTALHHAVQSKAAAVHALIELGIGVDVKDSYGRCALHVSASLGDLDMVYALLFDGANVDETDVNGLTPLHFAAQFNHTQVLKTLVGWRANLEAKDKNGETALHCAAFQGNCASLLALINLGANLAAKCKKGQTVVHKAVMGFAIPRLAGHMLGSLDYLGADIDARDVDGQTALHVATDPELVKVLVGLGANIEAADHRLQTALQKAVANGKHEIAQALLCLGARPPWKVTTPTTNNKNRRCINLRNKINS